MAFLLAKPTPHNVNHDNDRFSMFNKKRDIAWCASDEGFSGREANSTGRSTRASPIPK
jgi:hypothetical protein